MGWVRIDDAFYDHPKWIEAGPIGVALGMYAIAWCNRNLTDGFVPVGKVPTLADFSLVAVIDGASVADSGPGQSCAPGVCVDPLELAGQLVKLGLWDEVPGGFQVHDYLTYQRSADEIRGVSEKRAEAGRRGGSKPPNKPGTSRKQTNKQKRSKPGATQEAELRTPTESPNGDSRADDYTPSFEAAWSVYPKKLAKRDAFDAWKARLKQGVTVETMTRAVANYAAVVKASGTEEKFMMHGSTFFGPHRRYEDYLEPQTSADDNDPAGWFTNDWGQP